MVTPCICVMRHCGTIGDPNRAGHGPLEVLTLFFLGQGRLEAGFFLGIAGLA